MRKCTVNGNRLNCARFIQSPNFDLRPKPDDISLIVIHCISLPPNKFNNNYIIDFFTNKLDSSKHPYFEKIKTLQVSSHLLILRNGDIIQFVDFNKRAWHCGESFFQGRTKCNDFSIGIELEGADDIKYTEIQYQKLLMICKILKKNYPIKNIVGHCDIAPGRKTDPGDAFDWQMINGVEN